MAHTQQPLFWWCRWRSALFSESWRIRTTWANCPSNLSAWAIKCHGVKPTWHWSIPSFTTWTAMAVSSFCCPEEKSKNNWWDWLLQCSNRFKLRCTIQNLNLLEPHDSVYCHNTPTNLVIEARLTISTCFGANNVNFNPNGMVSWAIWWYFDFLVSTTWISNRCSYIKQHTCGQTER